MEKKILIRDIYLHLFALIGLVLLTIGFVRLINLTLKTYVFTKADVFYSYPTPMPIAPGEESLQFPSREEIEDYQNKERTSKRQREAAESLAFIIAGLPLYFYHWSAIRKNKAEEVK